MKIEVKLDERVLKYAEITNEELASIMEKGKFEINSSSIKITHRETSIIFGEILRFIKDPYTGIKRFDDNDAENLYIKIDGKEYNVQINCVERKIRENYKTILGIIK